MSFVKLVVDYMAAVEEILRVFERKFGRRDLLRAWRERAISQSGQLQDDVQYHMHGYGCAVEYPDYDVDFDFAGVSEVGFDAWRLWRYAKQFPDRYPSYQELDAVEAALARSLTEGSVERIELRHPGEGNRRLYRLIDVESDSVLSPRN
jgi:hypothetical protein